MSRGTHALISRSALQHNFNRVKQFAPNARVWSVVKANAYGHDAELVASVLTESDGFAVSTFKEALSLRAQGIETPIILLEGVTETEHWPAAASSAFQCVIHSFEQIAQLHSIELTVSLKVWVKLDTGMHRLGFLPEQFERAISELNKLTNVDVIGTMTHLACADDEEQNVTTESQVQTFSSLANDQLLTSIGNSAGIVAGNEWQGDWVRPGIMLYGATPLNHKSARDLGLWPVMSFETPVIALRTVLKGDKIGYGHQWMAERDSVIATLAAGYGDGYPRHAPNGTPILLNGQIVPLCGRVSMDMIMVDVTDLGAVAVGDVAELWGKQLSVDKVAEAIGTIGYELLTRISPRVEKILID